MKIYNSKGIIIKERNLEISCDITRHRKTPLLFISHVHSDHITKNPPKTDIICSKITEGLYKNFVPRAKHLNFFREYKLGDTFLHQISSGHTVGSTALIIEAPHYKLLYTGDLSIRAKGFTRPFVPQKCDILIIEATFGEPKFVFPAYENEIKRARELIRSYMDNHIPVVLMGYAYGKSQMLYHNFADLSDEIILHGANYNINSVLRTIDETKAVECISYQYAKEKRILDNKSNWILFSPLKSGKSGFNSYLKDKFNAKLFAFSGWCYQPNYKYRMNVDHTIVLSDHPDFNELISICETCSPDQIYTVYGSHIRFAGELRKRGFNAFPLSPQSTLDSFFTTRNRV